MLSSELLVTQIVEIQWPYGTELLIEWSERFEPFLDIVLWSWARHLTLTVPLSTRECKWVLENVNAGGNPVIDWHPIQGGVEIILVTLCYRNQDKIQPDEPLSSYADFTLTTHFLHVHTCPIHPN